MKNKRYVKFLVLPIICIAAGIALSAYITYQYAEEYKNSKLPSAQAEIVDMTSYEKSGAKGRIDTVYIISYQYEIDGVLYESSFNSYSPKLVGDNIEIKYNPENPSVSTAVTAPDTKSFAFVLCFGFIFIVVGAVIAISVYKNRYQFIVEMTGTSDNITHTQNQKRNPKAYFGLLLPLAVFLIAVALMYFQPFAQKSINADEFAKIMQTEGYEAENSLERLQIEFGMGSLIEQAYSVNTDVLRIDFCQLNTSHNARLLYNSAFLPDGEQVIDGKNMYASQDEEFFYIKLTRNNTFVYGACSAELKTELLQLLSDLDYYNE